jgi:two-component system, chemotaxis family, response regulator Rcp1
MEIKPLEILLVEDNAADVRLAREVLKSDRVWTNLNVVKDGVEAMQYLRRRGKFAGAPRPDVILLDLNLPKKDGWEVLSEIRADAELKAIPVAIMSSSEAEQDIHEATRLEATCYITKPVRLGELLKVVKSVADFRVAIIKVPPGE